MTTHLNILLTANTWTSKKQDEVRESFSNAKVPKRLPVIMLYLLLHPPSRVVRDVCRFDRILRPAQGCGSMAHFNTAQYDKSRQKKRHKPPDCRGNRSKILNPTAIAPLYSRSIEMQCTLAIVSMIETALWTVTAASSVNLHSMLTKTKMD